MGEKERFDPERYIIIPFKSLKLDLVIRYWDRIARVGRLQDRLGSVVNPDMDDVYKLLKDHGENNHYIVDFASDAVVGEFMVMPITGKVGVLHFSTHPQLGFARAISLGKMVNDDIFNKWKDGDTPSEPYLTSLMGITPVLNRVACLYVLRTGFKRVMEIPNGCHYRGELSTALMTILHNTN